jgi:hypothetical protein
MKGRVNRIKIIPCRICDVEIRTRSHMRQYCGPCKRIMDASPVLTGDHSSVEKSNNINDLAK